MSLPSGALPPFDDLEALSEPSIRIPPLLPPLNVAAIPKPSPLEPSTRINTGKTPATQLDVHGKLAESSSTRTPTTKDATSVPVSINPIDLNDGSRKRQKLDFLQLPKPTTPSKVTANATGAFPAIPLLNGLRQPPPGAARFPPITPEKPRIKGNESTASTSQTSIQIDLTQDSGTTPDTVSTKQKSKRQYLRGRRPWTDQETKDLLIGVETHGVGKWKSILKDHSFQFHSERSAVDLKDRYRTYQLAQSRPKKQQPAKDKPKSATRSQIESNKHPEVDSITSTPNHSKKLDFQITTMEDVKENLSKVSDSGTLANPQRFVRWSKEEDTKLVQANSKHGFKWTAIAQDSESGLMHRTAGQIRDRFRVKFPQNYQSNTLLSSPNTSAEQNMASAETKTSEDNQKSKGKGNLDWLLQDNSMEDINASFARLSKEFDADISKNDDMSTELATSSKPNLLGSHPMAITSSAPLDHFSEPNIHSDQLINADISAHMDLPLDTDEARNPNIEDLLNDDIEPLSHLPPLKFPFDQDWSGDAYDDSLTLAPLIWGSYDFMTGQWVGGMNG